MSEKLKKLKEMGKRTDDVGILSRLEKDFREKLAEDVAKEKLAEHQKTMNKMVEGLMSDLAEHEVKMKKEMSADMDAKKQEFARSCAAMMEGMQSDMEDADITMNKMFQTSLASFEARVSKMRGKQGEDGRTPIKGIDYTDGKPGEPGKDGSPDTGGQIVAKVNALPPTPDMQIDASHIKNLDRYIKKEKKGKTIHRGGSSPLYYDLSSLCDGVTKSFTIPSNSSVIWLGGTDAPTGQYRRTTDYTVSGNTLTLTSEVIAPQVGATLHLIYIG